jgi:CRISPR-associated endonuclease/helicase Cas3
MQPLESFQTIIDFTPNPTQIAMWQQVTGDDCAVLLKSPTGSGKTEAVLVPSLAMERRLFMIYPARSLVEDQIGRIETLFMCLSKNGKRRSLVVDTGGQSSRRLFEGGQEVTDRQFNSRRHLYDGDVIVTTLDKFLYRFFGFGDERKGYIFPFRIFHGLRRNLFVFDEAHAYEDTAFTNFVRLIKALYTAGLDVVVMTATMPDDYAKELEFMGKPLDFVDERRPELEAWERQRNSQADFSKILYYVLVPDKTSIADAIAAQALQADSKRLIVTVETVEDAIKVWGQLGKPLLYHGRLDSYQRRKVYGELKQLESDDKNYLLVTTSAIEVGCDLNADCLITEICNPASLIQRAGRCNRRGDRKGAQIVVVGNSIKPFLRDISKEQEAVFVETLKAKTGQQFQPADFLRFMQRGVTFDYRAEILFDMLFEYIYEARLENKPLHDKGLIITRSWEPAVTLTTDHEKMEHAISVPISRCAGKESELDNGCRVFVRHFWREGDEYKVEYEPMGERYHNGWAYFRDIVIEKPDTNFDATVGWREIPKVFRSGWRDGYQVTLSYRVDEKKQVRLRYLDWKIETPDTIVDAEMEASEESKSEEEE